MDSDIANFALRDADSPYEKVRLKLDNLSLAAAPQNPKGEIMMDIAIAIWLACDQ